ncbi:MAG: TonB-dependent receptor domain-containing protein [Aridibacter sp.]
MKKLLSILYILVCLSVVSAQTSTGSLTGIVSSSDGVLPGATVTATDIATKKTLTVTTNDSGSFTFPQLEAGTYRVNVTSSGFKTFIANELKIDVGRVYSLNPLLQIGDIQESVTVTAGADVVTATTAQVSNTVSPQQILALPLITRNPLALTTLQAGVQSNPFQNTTINGARTSFTNITRDGINIQDNFIRSNATDFAPGRPTVDDTAEFTIITSNQEADQGYGSAQIRLTTPRGGKNFSGALYAYNRNSAFSANNFFSNRAGQELPFRNRNQFGGKIGGPLPTPNFGEGGPVFDRDKGFFFFNYEKIIDPLSVLRNRTILTPSARSGAFRYNRTIAGSPINSNGVSCPSGAVGSVCTITDFLAFARASNLPNTAGSPIPTTINPVIQSRIISQLPTDSNTAVGGDGLNTAGFAINRAANNEGLRATGRIDVDLTDKDSINGVYAYNFETNIRNDLDSSGFTPIPRGSQTAGNKTLALAYRRIISPRIVNEVRGGLFFSEVPFQRDIPNPTDFLLSVQLVSNPENNFQNQGRTVKTYNLQDNLDVIVGKHSLKFGGQIQKFRPTANNFAGTTPILIIQPVNGITPSFITSNFAGAGGISNSQLGTANGLLGLLGGFIVQAQQRFNLTDPNATAFENAPEVQPFEYENYSLYAGDRWQITNNLTLNFGVRYELFPALRLANGLGLEPVITDPGNPEASLLDRNGSFRPIGGNSGRENAYYKTDYNNFAPSIGFAYAPKFGKGIGKLLLGESVVIRGGFSRAFGNDQIVTAVDNAASGNVGFAGRTGFVLDPTTGSNLLNLRLGVDAIPPFTAPDFVPPPFSFVRNNTPGISSTANFGTVFAIDPEIQTPSIDQYSFGVQREFFGNTALEVRYVGTRSGNLARGIDLNQIDIFNNGFLADFNRAAANLDLTGNPFCTTAGCQALSIFRNTGSSGPGIIRVGGSGNFSLNTLIANLQNGTPADLAFTLIQQGRNNSPTLNNPTADPFINFVPNPAAGVVDILGNFARYNYNSLQVELRRRFSQGLYFQANYTFSKNLSSGQGNTQSQFEPFLDNNNPELDYQRADTDQTHVFNFNGVYQLPFGKGRPFLNQGGIVDKILGGFEISGIVTYASGAPITFVDNRGTLNRGGRSGRQTAFSNLTNDQLRSLVGIFERDGNIFFINPDIIDPNTGRASNGFGSNPFDGQVLFNVNPGETGNIGRAIIDGPNNFNINTALLKNIAFNSERTTRLQLRMEVFNLLNNVNFFNNTQFANINSSSFGQIESAGSARTIQFGARFEF